MLAPQPGERDDLVDGRNAIRDVHRGGRADERNPGCWIARAQRPQQGRRLQSLRHSAIDDDRDVHGSTV